MLCAESLTKAIPLAADPSYSPRTAAGYGTWQIQKCYLHLYGENQVVMDWDVPLQAFGGKTGFEMAKIGYSHHSSQQEKWFAVKQEGDYDCRKFGLYYTAVGPDTGKKDFFEISGRPIIPSGLPRWIRQNRPIPTTLPPHRSSSPETGWVPIRAKPNRRLPEESAGGSICSSALRWWCSPAAPHLRLLRRQHRSARHFKIE